MILPTLNNIDNHRRAYFAMTALETNDTLAPRRENAVNSTDLCFSIFPHDILSTSTTPRHSSTSPTGTRQNALVNKTSCSMHISALKCTIPETFHGHPPLKVPCQELTMTMTSHIFIHLFFTFICVKPNR